MRVDDDAHNKGVLTSIQKAKELNPANPNIIRTEIIAALRCDDQNGAYSKDIYGQALRANSQHKERGFPTSCFSSVRAGVGKKDAYKSSGAIWRDETKLNEPPASPASVS